MNYGNSMHRRLAVLRVLLPIIFGILQFPLVAGFPGATRVVVPGDYGRADYKQIRNLKVGDKVVSCYANGGYVETTIQRIEEVSFPAFFNF